MDHGACNVVYLDRRAQDEFIRRDSMADSLAARASSGRYSPGYFAAARSGAGEIRSNIETILSVFNEVHICGSGAACLAKLASFGDSSTDHSPTLLLIDVPYDEEQRLKRLSREPRTPSPTCTRRPLAESASDTPPDDIYGMHLLTHVSSEIREKALSKLVVPVVVLSGFDREWASSNLPSPSVHGSQVLTDTVRLVRFLDAGAVDVLASPLTKDRVHGLAVHAYRIYKEVSREESNFLATKRNRKLSWVGVNEEKPFAYLREAMVSGLMSNICNPDGLAEAIDPRDVDIGSDRQTAVAGAIAGWYFSAHDFSDDELLYAALVMLQHTLKMPELEKWRMPADDLITFLIASRDAYNSFVFYHNFRHVVDVLQALFHFLVRIGIIPPYPETRSEPTPPALPAVATLLKPFDAFTLLISAIGHDVGHPGVNNAFLVALNAPLAQLYNDRSVLESFHCAAYSQILRRYWPTTFSDIKMRKLMINSILATDMGLHFKYMADLGNLQEKLADNGHALDGFNGKQCEEFKDLACGLLIKCADISNVARKFEAASRWAAILTDEFSNQGTMEKELDMPSCLFGGPPERDNMVKMAESQIGFMNIFARPLFEAVADILPAMRFSVDEILRNKGVWESKIEAEKRRATNGAETRALAVPGIRSDGGPSPMSGSNLDLSETKHDAPRVQSEAAPVTVSALQKLLTPSKISMSDRSSRRSSGGTPLHLTPSRRSSLGLELASRRSSTASPLQYVNASENTPQSQSRRGSGDASLTAILVTESPVPSDPPPSKTIKPSSSRQRLRSLSPLHRVRQKAKATAERSPTLEQRRESRFTARPLTSPLSAMDGGSGPLVNGQVPRHQHSEADMRGDSKLSPGYEIRYSQSQDNMELVPETHQNGSVGLKVHGLGLEAGVANGNGAANSASKFRNALRAARPRTSEAEPRWRPPPRSDPGSGTEKDGYLTNVHSNASSTGDDTSPKPGRKAFSGLKFWKRKRKGGYAGAERDADGVPCDEAITPATTP